ncbi:MAG: hypothetical protein N2749_00585 [Clostridia bacterium]|nr:hypothetical protein [Clostridia bacterium]
MIIFSKLFEICKKKLKSVKETTEVRTEAVKVYFCDVRTNRKLSESEQQVYITSIISSINPDVHVTDAEIVQLIIDWTKNGEPIKSLMELLRQIDVKFPIKLSELSGKHNETFTCKTADGKELKISLYFGDFFEDFDELHVELCGKTSRYNYFIDKLKLKLQSTHIEREGVKLSSYYCEYFCHRTLTMSDGSEIILNVDEPELENEKNIQVLNNAEAIEEFLLSMVITPKISFYECYQKIKELYQFSNETMKLINVFKFCISKKINEKYSYIQDSIVLNKGVLQQYANTIFGETTLWNMDGTWSYRLNGEYSILGNSDEAVVTFVIKKGQKTNGTNVSDLVNEAKREVVESVEYLIVP